MLLLLLAPFACSNTPDLPAGGSQAGPGPTAAADAAPAREQIKTFVDSWAALVAVVPATETPPAKCEETGGPIVFIDFEDLQAAAGVGDAVATERLSPPGLLAQLAAPLSDEEAVAFAEKLDETVDRAWVRRIFSRTQATTVSSGPDAPPQLIPGEVRGVLALVGRTPPRLLCATPLRATNRDKIVEADPATFAEVAERDLDRLFLEATLAARLELTGSQLDFPDNFAPPDLSGSGEAKRED